MGKATCEVCNKKVKGQAIKLSESSYVHLKCFTCKECKKELPAGAFFIHNKSRYCKDDYQKLFGSKCSSCGKSAEGDVVTILGKTYHQECLVCTKCKKTMAAGSRVSITGSNVCCQPCYEVAQSPDSDVEHLGKLGSPGSPVERPQAMSVSMTPNHLNSPSSDYATDARDGTGDESFATSPDVFQSPTSATSGYKSDISCDQDSFDMDPIRPNAEKSPIFTDAIQEMSNGHPGFGRFYQTSFLDKGTGFKRGPSQNPQQQKPQHYHRPDNFSYRKVRTDLPKPKKPGIMNQLGNLQVAASVPAQKFTDGPYKPIKSQEPIQLSKIPDAQRNDHGYQMPIERDDFVAPPEPAAIYPELLREGSFRVKSNRNGDSIDGEQENKENEGDEEMPPVDPKVEKEINELAKMERSGTARLILEDLKRKKLEPMKLDPWSCSRTPSASAEPPQKTRFESPVFASPSRDSRRARLWQFDQFYDQKYRTCASPTGRRPGQRFKSHTIDARTGGTKSAMAFRSRTLDRELGISSAFDDRNGYMSDAMDGYYSSDITFYHRRPESSSAVLDRSYTPLSDAEEYDETTGLRKKRILVQRWNVLLEGRETPNPRASLRRNVAPVFGEEEPAKVYPYEALCLDNPKRPHGLDNNNLERHLADEDFQKLFAMDRSNFMNMAEWKRNDLKQRVRLFESIHEKPATPIST